MERINVIGTSGSGKSTFARKLAQCIDAPYVEMDALFWGPNWHWSPDEEFFQKLSKAIEGDRWVLDGNYTRTNSIKWQRATMVIWIDLPLFQTVYQAIKRAVSRSISQKELWEGTNNRESFSKTFLSKDSIVLWTLKTYAKNKKKYEALCRDSTYSHVNFKRFKSHKEASKFLSGIARPY